MKGEEMGIEIHPRTMKVGEAKAEIGLMIARFLEKKDLTFAEINGILLEIAQGYNKLAIRHERHPGDPEKKGDEA